MKRKGQQNWISHKEHMGFYKIKFKLNGSQWAHQVKKKLSFFLPYDENVILFHLALTFPHDFDLSSVILEEDLEMLFSRKI